MTKKELVGKLKKLLKSWDDRRGDYVKSSLYWLEKNDNITVARVNGKLDGLNKCTWEICKIIENMEE